jgi:hypothetical protein
MKAITIVHTSTPHLSGLGHIELPTAIFILLHHQNEMEKGMKNK